MKLEYRELKRFSDKIEEPKDSWYTVSIFIIVFITIMLAFIVGIRNQNKLFINETMHLFRQSREERLSDLVMSEQEVLKGVVRDYSQWNDLYYNYMIHPTTAFEKATFQDINLENFKINMIMILDEQGQEYFYNDLNENNETYFDDHSRMIMKNYIQDLYAKSKTGIGFIQVKERIYLAAYHHITTTNGTAPSRGVMVMAKEVDQSFLAHMSNIRGSQVQFIKAKDFMSEYNPQKGEVEVINPITDVYGNLVGYFKHVYPVDYIENFEDQVHGQMLFIILMTLIFSVGFICIISYIHKKNEVAIIKQVREKEKLLEEISQVNEQMDQDLLLAADYQQSLLPQQIPYFQYVTLDYGYIPSSKVGGDLFGVADLKDEKFAVWIADASGHGVQAAMIAMFIKSIFIPQNIGYIYPGEALSVLNGRLYGKLGDGFVTMFVALFDFKKQSVTYAGAGHIDQLFWSSGCEKFVHLQSREIPIGVLPQVLYPQEEITYTSGDQFMFLTDGVVELENDVEQIFDFGDLKAYLQKSIETKDQNACDKLYWHLLAIMNTRQLEDDFTFVSLKMK